MSLGAFWGLHEKPLSRTRTAGSEIRINSFNSRSSCRDEVKEPASLLLSPSSWELHRLLFFDQLYQQPFYQNFSSSNRIFSPIVSCPPDHRRGEAGLFPIIWRHHMKSLEACPQTEPVRMSSLLFRLLAVQAWSALQQCQAPRPCSSKAQHWYIPVDSFCNYSSLWRKRYCPDLSKNAINYHVVFSVYLLETTIQHWLLSLENLDVRKEAEIAIHFQISRLHSVMSPSSICKSETSSWSTAFPVPADLLWPRSICCGLLLRSSIIALFLSLAILQLVNGNWNVAPNIIFCKLPASSHFRNTHCFSYLCNSRRTSFV